jgi:hypothetical protein
VVRNELDATQDVAIMIKILLISHPKENPKSIGVPMGLVSSLCRLNGVALFTCLD